MHVHTRVYFPPICTHTCCRESLQGFEEVSMSPNCNCLPSIYSNLITLKTILSSSTSLLLFSNLTAYLSLHYRVDIWWFWSRRFQGNIYVVSSFILLYIFFFLVWSLRNLDVYLGLLELSCRHESTSKRTKTYILEQWSENTGAITPPPPPHEVIEVPSVCLWIGPSWALVMKPSS